MTLVAFWGVGELHRDGEVVADDRLVHFMLTERVRDPSGGYGLGFDEDVIHGEMHAHLLLPPVAVSPEGPTSRPVESGFTLPGGDDQPFLHIMFERISQLEGG